MPIAIIIAGSDKRTRIDAAEIGNGLLHHLAIPPRVLDDVDLQAPMRGSEADEHSGPKGTAVRPIRPLHFSCIRRTTGALRWPPAFSRRKAIMRNPCREFRSVRTRPREARPLTACLVS